MKAQFRKTELHSEKMNLGDLGLSQADYDDLESHPTREILTLRNHEYG
jgi:hypothetical protein